MISERAKITNGRDKTSFAIPPMVGSSDNKLLGRLPIKKRLSNWNSGHMFPPIKRLIVVHWPGEKAVTQSCSKKSSRDTKRESGTEIIHVFVKVMEYYPRLW